MIKKLFLIAWITLSLFSCSEVGTNEDEGGYSPPPTKTEETTLQKCAKGMMQNAVLYQYSYMFSQPLDITYYAYTFPLDAMFSDDDPSPFAGSTFDIQIVFHASGGDQVLVNETHTDTNNVGFTFDAFSSPMYISTAGDSFTVTVTSNMVVTYKGVTQVYPEQTESIDFTLDALPTTFGQWKQGELRTFDSSLTCPTFFNPVFSVESQSVGPSQFDLNIGVQMQTNVLDPYFVAYEKSSMPFFFERSLVAKLTDSDNVVIDEVNYQATDTTVDPYPNISFTFADGLSPGDYRLQFDSSANVNFGSGMKAATVQGKFDFHMDATGEITFHGVPISSKKSTTIGLALFE